LWLAAGVVCRPAQAAVVVTERDTVQTIHFANTATFADAVSSGATTLKVIGLVPDVLALAWQVPAGGANFQVVSNSPAFTVSSPVLNAGSPNAIEAFTISATQSVPVAGSVTVSEDLGVNAAPAGAIVVLSSGVSAGVPYLDELYNPAANQAVGVPFYFTVSINGNYAVAGTAAGQHQLVNINGGWAFDQNFVFNGTDTVFAAHINPYTAAQRIGLEFRVFGAPATAQTGAGIDVPFPPWVYGLLALGLWSAMARICRQNANES
jgi:hypothetical protein